MKSRHRTRFFRSLLTLLFGVVIAVILSQVPTQGFEVFALDFKQRLAFAAPPTTEYLVRRLPGREQLPFQNRFEFTETQILKELNQLNQTSPKAIILFLSKNYWSENVTSAELQSFRQKLEADPRLFIYTDGSAEQILTTPEFQKFPRVFSLADSLGIDAGEIPPQDAKIRRLLLHFESNETDTEVLNFLRDELATPVKASDFRWSFNFWETQQIYLKFWPAGSFDEHSGTAGKVVFLTFADIFATEHSAAPIGSVDRFKNGNEFIGNGLILDADLAATVLTNLSTQSYVKSLPPGVNFSFTLLFCVLLSYFCLNLNRPREVLKLVFVVTIGNVIPVGVFLLSQFWLHSIEILLASFLIPYFVLPVVLYRLTKKRDLEKLWAVQTNERLRHESQIAARSAEVEATYRLATQVAHDIRNPLSALNIVASLLPLDNERRTLMKDGLARIEQISASLLSRYRERSKLNTEICHLENLYRNLNEHCQTVFSDVEVVIEAKDETSYLVCPALRLEQHLINLITNAVEALRKSQTPQPRIALQFYRREDSFMIRVSDNGPGIAAEIRDRLFEAHATFGKENGTGFALSAVREFVESLGGQITHEESTHAMTQNAGASFLIRLPLSSETIFMFQPRPSDK